MFLRTRAGRIHRGTRTEDGDLQVRESCNLDDAPGTEAEITFAELERADAGDLCRRCWPTAEGARP